MSIWNWGKRAKINTTNMPKRIYLDYAAATPVSDSVLQAMVPYFQDVFGNAGGIHQEGVIAKRVVEDCREKLARVLGVQETGVVFTSGGTESNNLALVGAVKKLVSVGRAYKDLSIVTTKLEHPATLKTLEGLAVEGVEIIFAPVTEVGTVDLKQLESVLKETTVLCSFSYINSEVGAINKVRDIRRVLDLYGKKVGHKILLHVDAAQAPMWLPCDLPRLGADLLSLDAGKCCGPKGVGVLAMQKGVAVSPLLRGGGQEMGLRPGTEPLPLIVGAATALVEAQADCGEVGARVALVRDYFLAQIAEKMPQAIVNGPLCDSRAPNNVHISIPGLDAEFAVISLDAKGIACSTKSACSTKGGGASTVVLAMTGDEARALSTLRFTLSPDTNKEDIDFVVKSLVSHVVNSTNL